MNSLTSKRLIVELLSALSISADNNQSKPTSHTTPTKQALNSTARHAKVTAQNNSRNTITQTNRQAGLSTTQQNCLASLIKLGLMGGSWLILPLSSYAAISASTSQTIQGTEPYFVFKDSAGTRNKLTTIDALLGFKYKDVTGAVKWADASVSAPITVQAGMTEDELEALVPITAGTSYNLQTLITAATPRLYIEDGDGDNSHTNTAVGKMTATFKKNGTAVAPTAGQVLDVCSSYVLEIKAEGPTPSTNLEAKTQYGDPKSRTYPENSATYTILPSGVSVCNAKPDMSYATDIYAGPVGMWDTAKGFITQSTNPASYSNNFPTTGANGLYFELNVQGNTTELTWTTETVGTGAAAITATPSACATPSIHCVKYKLTGPAATATQIASASPSALALPAITASVPAKFVLKGSDSTGVVARYGFNLQRWYTNRGSTSAGDTAQGTWCTKLGYRLPKVNDLTNAAGGAWPGATPSSGGNYYSRRINGGLFSEWGYMYTYTGSGFASGSFWTGVTHPTGYYFVSAINGSVGSHIPGYNPYGLCTYP